MSENAQTIHDRVDIEPWLERCRPFINVDRLEGEEKAKVMRDFFVIKTKTHWEAIRDRFLHEVMTTGLLSLSTVSYTHLRAPRDKRQSRMPSSA